jgi:iron complex outermembrane receptor protein
MANRIKVPKVLLVALCALAPALASANPRIEAKRHFQRGMGLISRGEYDEGIRELRQAYSIKPHPNVLYNIARAYLDAGKVQEAIDSYRRYLEFNPSDAAQVKATVARLEESIRPSASPQPPPPAETAARPPPPPPSRGAGPSPGAQVAAVDPESLRRLNELMGRLESAVAKAEAAAAAQAAQAAEPARGGAPASGPSRAEASVEGVSAESRPYEETVETASRRAQSTLEAPNATTVITSDEIRLSGASSITELLRRVPGAEVMTMGVGSTNVSFRGFNQRLANKVLVLLDGRTEYQDFLGLTVWPAIPVGLEEIERIEVIRGPGSALYGANAMLGVVNIITKKPARGTRGEFTASAGTGDTASVSYVAYASDGQARYRASGAFNQADKWSRDFGDTRTDYAPRASETDLGLRTARANLVASYALSRDVELAASGGVNRFFTEFYPIGLLRNFYLDGLGSYVKTDLTFGPVKLKLFWNHLVAAAGPQYSAIGERSLDTTLSSDVLDGEALWGHQFDLFGAHHLQVGVEARNKRVAWSYLSSNLSELHFAGFIQDEWRVIDPVRVLASYRIDRHPLLNGGEPGFAHSPRVSAVWSPVEGHAVRASLATAFREPTLLENYTEIRIPAPGIPGASALTVGNTALRPERLIAYELGYRGEYPPLGLEWDISLYQNEVRDLINVQPFQRLPAGEAYDAETGTFLLGRSTFDNERGLFTARGAELGVRLSPVDGLDLTASGAFQQITQSEVDDPAVACAPCSQAPAVKLFGAATYRSRVGFDFTVEAAFTSASTFIEREPSPQDPTQILYIPNPVQPYTVINARVGYKLLDDRVAVALVGTNLGPSHTQHPFGNLISRRFFVTLSVAP